MLIQTQRVVVEAATVREVVGLRAGLPSASQLFGGGEPARRAAARVSAECGRRCLERRVALMAVRRAAAAFQETHADSLVLEHRPGGPPRALSTTGARVPLTFAIAHARGRAIAAATTPGMRIGVDLERDHSVDPAHVRYFAAPSERARGESPTALWVVKEAVWKALGCRDTMPFRALRLERCEHGGVSAVHVEGERITAVATVWSPWRGWIAALAELPVEHAAIPLPQAVA